MNQLISLKGGSEDHTQGGDASGCFDYEDTNEPGGFFDVRIHQYNDDNSYNGWFSVD